MIRREFIAMAGGALASGSITARAFGQRRRGTDAGVATPMTAADYHAERRYASTPFGKIAYVERGSGDVALFLHGFPLSSFQWRGALPRLAPHRRCIAPDFMSHGYTQIADGQSVAPEAQVQMVVALLDALRISAVDLIANDSGGAVAQLLVTRHGSRIRTLLLTNCDTEKDSPPPALLPVIELAKAGTWADLWLGAWLADKELARSAQGIGGLTFSEPGQPTDEAIDYYFAPMVSSARRKAQVHAYAIALERNPLMGIEAALKRCTVPTRILWGTADAIFSAASPDYLDQTFGNSRGVRKLAGKKLFFPEEVPEIVSEEALRLWSTDE